MRRWFRLPEKLSYRLVILYVALFVISIGAVIGIGLFFANRQIASSVDHELSGIAETAQERIANGADPQLVLNDLATQTQFFELLDANGAITLRSSNLRFDTLPSFIRRGQPTSDGYHSYSFRKTPIRLLRRAFIEHDEAGNDIATGYLVVAIAVPSAGESTLDLAAILLVAAGVGLVAVVGGSIFVARREVLPLQRLAEDVLTTAESGFVKPISAVSSGSKEARDLHRAFNELVTRQQQLIRRERAFFADSSHVLRTPLAVLQGDIEMLEQGVYGKERQEAVAQARAAIDTMSRTISGLLLLSREEDRSGSGWEVVDLGEMVNGLVTDARTAFPSLEIRSELGQGLEVAGNPHQLRDLFLSLAENACRYTPEGGKVSVTGAAMDGEIVVTVSDSGIGFSEEDVERATQRFYRGVAARKLFPGGSGLGLAIASRIVAMHNGSMEFGANAGGGARVTVRLPMLG